jgi:N-acetyl sugar amidotransferase
MLRTATSGPTITRLDRGARQTCKRCLYDSSIPGTTFDERGICNYCALHDRMDASYPTGDAGATALRDLAAAMKRAGRKRRFDCIVGVSGGCDSSFLVHQLVELGVRPLAVHFDNTWNSPIATNNIYTVLDALDVELETYVVDNREYDDLYRAFMLAGVRDLDSQTDIALMTTMYKAAERHGIRYIAEGHCFRTEGISPLGWLYMDGRYIRSIHRAFGTVPLKTFPNLTFSRFVKWAALSGIKRFRPLYYIDYNKEATKRFLSETYEWEWYGGHHLENRFTAFVHSYFFPRRFGLDNRVIELSARVRDGQIDRGDAEKELANGRHYDPDLVEMVKKRLGFDDDEFEAVMTAPRRHYTDYATYKKTFERLRPFFWLLYKLDRVPESFYVKFCRRTPDAGHEVADIETRELAGNGRGPTR